MQGARNWLGIVVTLGVAIPLATFTVASASAYEPQPPAPRAAPDSSTVVNGPPRIEVTPIHWFEQPVGRTARIYVAGGYCRGEPVPVIDRIVVHEHRLPGKTKLAAVIRVYLERPAPLELDTGPSRRAGEGPANVVVCAGVENSFFPRVLFKREADELVLFDGSESPPIRIPPRKPEAMRVG